MKQSTTGARANRLTRNRDRDAARQARLDRWDRLFDRLGQVAGEQQELGHAEAAKLARQPGEKRPAAAFQQRLWPAFRQRPQSSAEATGEDGALPDRNRRGSRVV